MDNKKFKESFITVKAYCEKENFKGWDPYDIFNLKVFKLLRLNMSTSILEAMAFGMPIITRPVGGVKDFFISDKMGFLIESLNHKDYYRVLIELIDNPIKLKEMGTFNHEFAKKNFLASTVANSIELTLKEMYNKNNLNK